MSIFRVTRKFLQILSKKQKRNGVFLMILMVIGGVMEMFSVSMILPFMDAVMAPDNAMNKWYSVIICEIFHIETSRSFLLLAAISLAVIYITKNIYLLLE